MCLISIASAYRLYWRCDISIMSGLLTPLLKRYFSEISLFPCDVLYRTYFHIGWQSQFRGTHNSRTSLISWTVYRRVTWRSMLSLTGVRDFTDGSHVLWKWSALQQNGTKVSMLTHCFTYLANICLCKFHIHLCKLLQNDIKHKAHDK